MTDRDAPRSNTQSSPIPPPSPRAARSTGVTIALLAFPVAMIVAGLALVLPSLWRVPSPSPITYAPPPGSVSAGKPTAGPVRPWGTELPPPQILPLADAVRSVTPATPWLEVAAATPLTRIGFGSCLHQNYPQPIWSPILATKPQLFLMIGDNVYGDIKSADGRELVEAYRRQLAHPEFGAARATLPMLGVWDDHDYGLNDGGAAFPHRDTAMALYRAYWQQPSSVVASGGVYTSRIYGPDGQRVQIILLDTRSFRAPFARKPEGSALFGKYGPDADPSKTMLGDAQWAWLEAELLKPADVRLVVSSVQVLSEGHAFERWGNLPRERDRLIALIEKTRAKGVVLLSGDRHIGAIYNRPIAAGQILIEITSSSLNRSYGPAKDVPTAELVSDLHHVENFGVIDIDWSTRRLSLSLRGMGGEVLDQLSLALADLGAGK